MSIEREDPVSEFSSSNITLGNGLPQLLLASSEVVKGRVPSPSLHSEARHTAVVVSVTLIAERMTMKQN